MAKKPDTSGEPEVLPSSSVSKATEYFGQRVKSLQERVGEDIRSLKDAKAREYDQKIVTSAVEDVKREIAKHPDPPLQAVFSFLPVEMTRVSPFFPMSRAEMKHRPYEEQTWENPWGRLSIKGKRLSIHDEDVLFALLKLYRKKRHMTFQTSKSEICKEMGISRGRDQFRGIIESLERLGFTGVTIEIWEGKGKARKPVLKMFNTILSGGVVKDENKITITINQYFEEMFLRDLITSINLDFRAMLKGDTAKALYRFLEAQPGEYSCHLLTLAKAINLDVTKETRRIRALLREALKELKEKKYLQIGQINNADIVFMKKATSLLKKGGG